MTDAETFNQQKQDFRNLMRVKALLEGMQCYVIGHELTIIDDDACYDFILSDQELESLRQAKTSDVVETLMTILK